MAGIGPFDSFVFPGVYTQTLNEPPRVTAAGDIRFPAFIGVADETNVISNWEMIRGSSSIADNQIVGENVSSQLDGTNRNFTVTYKPIVTGAGTGTTTNDPNDVTVTVEGDPVPVASVNGSTGEIYLVSIPRSTDTVLVSYHFKKTDTLYTDEDLSVQADGSNTNFKVKHVPIVQGDNGGITTTSTSDVTVNVNNVAVTVSAVDGDTGIITLASAPADGDLVEVTYYSNNHQDTADILPSQNVLAITKVGLSPGASDFVAGTDFVLDTTGEFSTINWGHSYKIASGQHTIATEFFDDTQITVTLYDNRIFRREATGTTDSTNTTFTIEAPPMTGQGLGFVTDDPSKITAYVGTIPTDASAVTVTKISGSSKSITLETAPAADATVFVTQYTNRLADDTYTLTNTLVGATGVGTYTMTGSNTGTAMDVLWSNADTTVADPDFAAENVTYPAGTGSGNSDAQVTPGYAVEETISLTFIDSTSYVVTSDTSGGSGSVGDNTGWLNQTYIDNKTGFRVTVLSGATVSYAAADVIGYTVSPTFITSATPTRAILGARMTVTDTEDVGSGDTATVTTYNKSGNEPSIGDFYYVTLDEEKTDIYSTPYFFTRERDALAFTGPLSQDNPLGLAAHLSFLNGAPAVVLLQIPRASGSSDASDSAYISGIDVFNEPLEGGSRPALIQPLSTSTTVLSYLKQSNSIQSGIRYQNERISYFGFALNTSPTTAQTIARSIASERMIGLYPDGAITTVTDELGTDIEILVNGSQLASAITGRDTSPAFDVATPLTNKPIIGFKRLFRRLDSVVQAQTATAGLTVLEEQAASINIKIALTTDLTSVLTRTPSVIKIKDFVQKGARSALQPYIGQKFLTGKTREIEAKLGSYLKALRNQNIITAFTGISATPDENDPTIVRVEAFYSPVLPLLWIVITFNLRSRI